MLNNDLFGNPVIENELLRDKYIVPPFSVLDTKSGDWQNRKRRWKELGIKSELGQIAGGNNSFNSLSLNPRKVDYAYKYSSPGDTASIFDPVLCEIVYNWFCEGTDILDPFAGGSVRGIVANYLGYHYTGIDLSEKQILSNREQAEEILDYDEQPNWYIGDSEKVLDEIIREYDLIFSCPPYHDLEKYSDDENDLSNMNYEDFLIKYELIINKAIRKLRRGGFAVFVVGDLRDKEGYYKNFVAETQKIFIRNGVKFYNDMILLNPIASASMRANNSMKNKKVVKIHQNILVFKKP